MAPSEIEETISSEAGSQKEEIRRLDEETPEGGGDGDGSTQDEDDTYDGDFEDYSPDVARNISDAYNDCVTKGESSVSVLRDEWTPGGEQPPNCTFPFVYRGKIYYACTDIDYAGRFWCANDCDFSEGELLHRGECNIPRNTRGVLGTGVALNTLNAFVAFMFAVGFTVLFVLCFVEWRRRRNEKGTQIGDENATFSDSIEMGDGGGRGRQVVPT